MKVVIFGSSGMVGQGALRECLLDPEVTRVVTVVRAPSGKTDPKLHEIVTPDPSKLDAFTSELTGLDACFFCIGVSSAGMSEADYRRVTYDLTVAVAQTLVQRSPGMVFVFVSGAGTDSAGDAAKGSSMWARVKGETENAVRAMPFKASYMFRPGFIEPLHGIRSRTRAYRWMYAVLWPLAPLVKALWPASSTTTENVGKAMLVAAKRGAPSTIIDSRVINELAAT
ncbi:MAG TPA: NAD-dependent epimerase/dehydratase family protein [Polyangiaceae bacterium]|jgi:uncharacterized protein YbjT (DUF2867 family)|nr:NAD-dependent epimerase/dehydratase family protein [Polyangiaceae bacterium]